MKAFLNNIAELPTVRKKDKIRGQNDYFAANRKGQDEF